MLIGVKTAQCTGVDIVVVGVCIVGIECTVKKGVKRVEVVVAVEGRDLPVLPRVSTIGA